MNLKKIIEVQNLTKEYKNVKAVDDLTFEVQEGEIIGLLGPNGSRKNNNNQLYTIVIKI